MRRTSELWLSVLIVVLALAATLAGLLFPSIYRAAAPHDDGNEGG